MIRQAAAVHPRCLRALRGQQEDGEALQASVRERFFHLGRGGIGDAGKTRRRKPPPETFRVEAVMKRSGVGPRVKQPPLGFQVRDGASPAGEERCAERREGGVHVLDVVQGHAGDEQVEGGGKARPLAEITVYGRRRIQGAAPDLVAKHLQHPLCGVHSRHRADVREEGQGQQTGAAAEIQHIHLPVQGDGAPDGTRHVLRQPHPRRGVPSGGMRTEILIFHDTFPGRGRLPLRPLEV